MGALTFELGLDGDSGIGITVRSNGDYVEAVDAAPKDKRWRFLWRKPCASSSALYEYEIQNTMLLWLRTAANRRGLLAGATSLADTAGAID